MTSAPSSSPATWAPAPAARLFELLWHSLSDLLGSATAATLLRRSRNSLARTRPGASDLQIDRHGLEYRYALPSSWSAASGEGVETIGALVDELRPLLMELTGEVILNQLDANAAFADHGIVFSR